jgi:hypothetical protein
VTDIVICAPVAAGLVVGGAVAPGAVVAAALVPVASVVVPVAAGAELAVVDTPDVEVVAATEWEVDELQAARASAARAAGSTRRNMEGV